MIQKIADWIVFSSKDPKKLSLTIKGVLLMVVPFAAHILPAEIDLPAVVDQITAVIEIGGVVVVGIVTLWGAIRKLATTWNGTNKVING